MEELLPQCSALTKSQKPCKNYVSRKGETCCSRHGGAKKNGEKIATGFFCGHITQDNVACKHHVKAEGLLCAWHSEDKKTCQKCKRIVKTGKDFCSTHDPEIQHQKEQFVPFKNLNTSFIKVFSECKDEKVRDLAKWYLELAEHAQESNPTDAFIAQWYVKGQSNAHGNSFGETHKTDPLKFLLSLPDMEKYRVAFENKISSLASDPKNGALGHFWEKYQAQKTSL